VKVTVITISDRASRGEYPDRSGPEIVSILREEFPEIRVAVEVVPDEKQAICERELPGIAEALRAESYKETPTAVLSRGAAGIKGNTIIVNFPGSLKAVRLCTRVLIPIMEHALSMLRGEGH
jgi:molybdopterin biosynthesis enzyme MoaB